MVAAYSVMMPRTHSAVIALSNRDDDGPWDLVNDIVALIHKAHRPAPMKVGGLTAKEVAREFSSRRNPAASSMG